MASDDRIEGALAETDDVEWFSGRYESSRWASVSAKGKALHASQAAGSVVTSNTAVVGPRKTRKSVCAISSGPPEEQIATGPEDAAASTRILSSPPDPSRAWRSSTSSLLALLLMVAVFLCLAWSLWLLLLTVAPNDTVNRVMATENLDNGSFWLLLQPSPALLGLAVFGLSVVALGFLSVLLVMTMRRKPTKRSSSVSSSIMTTEKLHSAKHAVERTLAHAAESPNSRISSFVASMLASLIDEDSSMRKTAKVWVKVADLSIQAVLLFQILEGGSPVPLVAVFTTIVTANALSCAMMMLLPFQQTGFAEVLIDTTFDFLVAVGYPMLVLLYCLSSFDFDRATLAINLEVFPQGSFEHAASLIADPMQTAIIYKSLKSLRITSTLGFLTRVGVNLALCFRLHRVAALVQNPQAHKTSTYRKRHRGVIFFVAFAILVVVFAVESVRTSSRACESHPECSVKVHRWTLLWPESDAQCPCLILIDGDKAPKTFTEWEQPKNVTDKVAQLATTGDLETIQLVNRRLTALPDELRACTQLTHLTLVYTHMTSFPPWMKEFSQLEYLHVEGTFSSGLVTMPYDMFDDMASLTFLHLGVHPAIRKLPSFAGLPSLKSLNIAIFPSLKELPEVDRLVTLERFLLAGLPLLDNLPDLSALQQIESLVIVDRGTFCCNGFYGECNLEHSMCQLHQVWHTPPATCLDPTRTDKLPTAATLELFDRFSDTVCAGEALMPGIVDGPPTPVAMDQCNGIMYRGCHPEGHPESTGICYNARFMGISCSASPFPIEMRRRQIQEGVGEPCDPEFEAWLGCQEGVMREQKVELVGE